GAFFLYNLEKGRAREGGPSLKLSHQTVKRQKTLSKNPIYLRMEDRGWRRFCVKVQSSTTPRLIAFLRAINVGGNTVKMEQLRSLFEALGLSNVETFIASGNVIFEAPTTNPRSLERQIERHLQQSLGYEVATFIRSATELEAIAQYKPFIPAELDAE